METEKTEQKFKGSYGESRNSNFKVIDSIGIPHTYCIGAKHLSIQYNDGIYLNPQKAEQKSREMFKDSRKWVSCEICKSINRKDPNKPILLYNEHKQGLIVSCKKEIKDNNELKEYLLLIKEESIKNGYVGFAFKKDF